MQLCPQSCVLCLLRKRKYSTIGERNQSSESVAVLLYCTSTSELGACPQQWGKLGMNSSFSRPKCEGQLVSQVTWAMLTCSHGITAPNKTKQEIQADRWPSGSNKMILISWQTGGKRNSFQSTISMDTAFHSLFLWQLSSGDLDCPMVCLLLDVEERKWKIGIASVLGIRKGYWEGKCEPDTNSTDTSKSPSRDLRCMPRK